MNLRAIGFIAILIYRAYGSEVINGTFFSVGFIAREREIESRTNTKQAINQVYCASRCVAKRKVSGPTENCNAYQYDKDTKICYLLEVPSPMKDVDSGTGIRIMFDTQLIKVLRNKLKLNLKAYFSLDGEKGLTDISGYDNTLTLHGAASEPFTDNLYGKKALRLENAYAVINQNAKSLKINNQNLMVCMWIKDYNRNKEQMLMSWRWNYRYTKYGSCDKSRTQCDLNNACNLVCTKTCGHQKTIFGKGTCISSWKNKCSYTYSWTETCSYDVHSHGIQYSRTDKGKWKTFTYLDSEKRIFHNSKKKYRMNKRWEFNCFTQSTAGEVKFYLNGALMSVDRAELHKNGEKQKNLNKIQDYPGIYDITTMTDEPIYIGQDLRDENLPTHKAPYITKFDSSIAGIQIYIGEEMNKDDVYEAMKLSWN